MSDTLPPWARPGVTNPFLCRAVSVFVSGEAGAYEENFELAGHQVGRFHGKGYLRGHREKKPRKERRLARRLRQSWRYA